VRDLEIWTDEIHHINFRLLLLWRRHFRLPLFQPNPHSPSCFGNALNIEAVSLTDLICHRFVFFSLCPQCDRMGSPIWSSRSHCTNWAAMVVKKPARSCSGPFRRHIGRWRDVRGKDFLTINSSIHNPPGVSNCIIQTLATLLAASSIESYNKLCSRWINDPVHLNGKDGRLVLGFPWIISEEKN